ncbi:FIVAR domain-containing protein [Staphylococcus aureus]
MKKKESVADNNSIKSGQNYTDATQANKQAYDNAVNAAKGVISGKRIIQRWMLIQ